MHKILLLSIGFFIGAFANTHPKFYAELGTPLFEDAGEFARYVDVGPMKTLTEEYSDAAERVRREGIALQNAAEPRKARKNYLLKLRALDTMHRSVLNTLRRELLDAIGQRDDTRFKALANTTVHTFYDLPSFKKQVLSYYENGYASHKIALLDALLRDAKIKTYTPPPLPARTAAHSTAASVPLYDVFWTSSIGTNPDGSHTGYVYGAAADAIDRARHVLDIGNSLNDICSDAEGNIYWANITKKAIYKANPDGSNAHPIITGLEHPMGVLIDEKRKRLYWSDWLQTRKPQEGRVGYADLEGNNKRVIIAQGLRSGGQLSIDEKNRRLYIADVFGYRIFSSSLEGVNLKFITSSPSPSGIDIDSQHGRLYWSDMSNDAIYSARLDGSNKKTLLQFNDSFASPNSLRYHAPSNRLFYNVDIEHHGVIESLDITRKTRRIEYSAEKLYNVGGFFIR